MSDTNTPKALFRVIVSPSVVDTSNSGMILSPVQRSGIHNLAKMLAEQLVVIDHAGDRHAMMSKIIDEIGVACNKTADMEVESFMRRVKSHTGKIVCRIINKRARDEAECLATPSCNPRREPRHSDAPRKRWKRRIDFSPLFPEEGRRDVVVPETP